MPTVFLLDIAVMLLGFFVVDFFVERFRARRRAILWEVLSLAELLPVLASVDLNLTSPRVLRKHVDSNFFPNLYDEFSKRDVQELDLNGFLNSLESRFGVSHAELSKHLDCTYDAIVFQSRAHKIHELMRAAQRKRSRHLALKAATFFLVFVTPLILFEVFAPAAIGPSHLIAFR